VKVVDLNVLIYATDTASKHHASARTWLDGAMASSSTIGLPTAVTVGFVRLVTNPRVMLRPLSPSRAIEIVESWLTRSNVSVPQPTARHYAVVRELLEATGVGGNLVSDAHLAALAIEYGAELCTFDSDFTRFPGVVSFRPS
jgi:uncharacterized protein